jgi:sialidase-1
MMVFALPDETYNNFRIPGLVLTQKETLLACCECRRGGGDDWAEIDLVVRRSTDEGESWTQTLLIPGGGNTMNNPMLTVCGDTVLFMYCQNYKRLFICESCDDGRTFTAPREIEGVFESGGFFYNVAAIGPGHGIVKDGVVLIPVWFAYNRENEKEHRPSFIATVYSEDAGKTWHLGEVLDHSELVNPSECALTVWQDRVLISIRNENSVHRRAFAVSTNGYSDWSKPAFYDNMIDPICQGSMDHTADAIYHINCDDEEARVNLSVKVSRDGFKTYEKRLIDEQGGYADLAVGKRLYVLYEKNFGRDGLFFLCLSK